MPRSKANWKKNRRHEITLPSGFQVEIEIPNLLELLKAGDVPNELVPIVTKTSQAVEAGRQVPVEEVIQFGDFVRFLVTRTVVDPVIEPAEIRELPSEDIDMILQFATRQRDLDAVGHHLGGLEKQSDFRSFRGFDRGAPVGDGL